MVFISGENIADNGAIKASYNAYLKWVQENGEEKMLPLLNLTHRQIFFVAFSQVFELRLFVHSVASVWVFDYYSYFSKSIVIRSNSRQIFKSFINIFNLLFIQFFSLNLMLVFEYSLNYFGKLNYLKLIVIDHTYSLKRLIHIFRKAWCSKTTDDSAHLLLSVDTHSPARYRVIGSVSNSVEFAKNFQCKPGSKMNPVKKCSVL